MFVELLSGASRWMVPSIMGIIVLHGYLRGVRVFEAFTEGGAEGLKMGMRLVPYIVGLFVAISVFRNSGALDLLTGLLSPVLCLTRVPGEVIPLMVVRPLSGVAALAMTVDLFDVWGPDSYVGRLASVIDGSTDTTLYVLAVYFASVGVRKPRHAVVCGLIGDVAGFAAAVCVTGALFGYG